MGAVDLTRPTSIDAQVILGSSLGTGGSDYYIKVTDYNVDSWSEIADLTGDRDNGVCIVPSLYLYCRVQLQGAMVATQALGLASAIDSAKNPTSAEVTLSLGESESLKGLFVIERFRHQFRRGSPFIGVAIVMHTTVDDEGEPTLTENA